MAFLRVVVKTIGVVMTLLTSAALIAFGVALLFATKFEINQWVYNQVDSAWLQIKTSLPELQEPWSYRFALVPIILLLGAFVLASLFLRGKRQRRSISFAGMHGEVTIELEDVEGTLEKVADKLPEVKGIAIRLEPTESRSRVLVLAQAVLMKDADAEARQVTDRVQDYIKHHARKILGVQDVEVRLKVRKFRLNMKSIKPMPLLLSGPEDSAAVAKVMSDGQASVVEEAPQAEEEAVRTS